MEVKQKLPQRKTPRAQWIEYNTGIYFVTVCTQNFIHYFGEISNGEIRLTELGNYLVTQIEESNQHHSYIEVLQYVVMPNHFHAIVEVKGTDSMADATGCVPTCEERIEKGIRGNRTLLSIFVGALKSSVTRYAHKKNIIFKWQGRYHDHLIRGVEDCNNISQYIENNILNWNKDCFYK
ncbi:MAG: hypothetical protein IKU59_03570 [Bacteroidales bacterium]|nr:hypothetical protein [Bacteroidales bacterium]